MREKRLIYSLTMLLVLIACGSALAQEKAGSNILQPEASGQNYCFTSGASETFMKVCFSKHGNVTWFESPVGLVHLKQREGYVACSGPTEYLTTPHGFDAGVAEDGWGNALVSQPNGAGKLPLVITRNSTDGKLQLKQTLNINATLREVFVKMEFKNLSTLPLENVIVDRYFDGDLDGDGKDDVYELMYGSVSGRDPFVHPDDNNNYGHRGLMLTLAATPSLNQGSSTSLVDDFADWSPFGNLSQGARYCSDGYPASTTSPGDYVGRLEKFLGTINKGASKDVTFIYRLF